MWERRRRWGLEKAWQLFAWGVGERENSLQRWCCSILAEVQGEKEEEHRR